METIRIFIRAMAGIRTDRVLGCSFELLSQPAAKAHNWQRSIKGRIVKTIFLRIFSYRPQMAMAKSDLFLRAERRRWFPHFPPTLRAR